MHKQATKRGVTRPSLRPSGSPPSLPPGPPKQRRVGNSSVYVDPVGHRCGQVGHDLHSKPPVVVHGVVASVGAGRGQGVGDSVDNRGRVCGAAVAVGLHLGDLLVKVLPAVVLAHYLGQLIPHLIGNGLNALGAVEAGGGDEVARFHHADLHAQRVHLVAQAVGEGLHPELGDAVGRAGRVGHAAQHAADVDDAACGGRRQSLAYKALTGRAEGGARQVALMPELPRFRGAF